MASTSSATPTSISTLLASCHSIIKTSLGTHTYRTCESRGSQRRKVSTNSNNNNPSKKQKTSSADQQHSKAYDEAVRREIQARQWLEAVKAEYALTIQRERTILANVVASSKNNRQVIDVVGDSSSSSSSADNPPPPPQPQQLPPTKRTQADLLKSISKLKQELYDATVDDQNKILFLSRVGRSAAEKQNAKLKKAAAASSSKKDGGEEETESEAREFMLAEKRKDRDAKACSVMKLAAEIREIRKDLHLKRGALMDRRTEVVESAYRKVEANEKIAQAEIQADQAEGGEGSRRLSEKARNRALRLALQALLFEDAGLNTVNWFELERVAWVAMQLEGGGEIRPFPTTLEDNDCTEMKEGNDDDDDNE
jgi:hypothetical protein